MGIDNNKVLRDGMIKATLIKDNVVTGAIRSILVATIEDAVSKHNFDNQTENLENSYGWAIYHNGQVIDIDIKGTGQGATRANTILSSYISLEPWEGVVIAGAKYAAELEGYVRHSDGVLSKSGDELFVLGKFFNFHAQSFIEAIKSLAR